MSQSLSKAAKLAGEGALRITRTPSKIPPKHLHGGNVDYNAEAFAKTARIEYARHMKEQGSQNLSRTNIGYKGDSPHSYIGTNMRKVPVDVRQFRNILSEPSTRDSEPGARVPRELAQNKWREKVLDKKVDMNITLTNRGLKDYLAKPSWSVSSLLSPSSSETDSELPEVTSKTLSHLLNLSALPQPKTKEEEEKMLKILSSQLHFVREIQSVDTTGVKPLSAIREETEEARAEMTIGLDALKEALGQEEIRGRMKRPRRRVDDKYEYDSSQGIVTSDRGAEWKPLDGAPRTYGKYFVVETEGKVEAGS